MGHVPLTTGKRRVAARSLSFAVMSARLGQVVDLLCLNRNKRMDVDQPNRCLRVTEPGRECATVGSLGMHREVLTRQRPGPRGLNIGSNVYLT
jgi:hypothetical protein